MAVTILFMLIGTGVELYLINHYEDYLQLIPLILIGLSLGIIVTLFFERSHFVMLTAKILLLLVALSGFYGVFLHLKANFEFEKEMKATESSWNLMVESLSGALPALAPLSMVILALIGYAYLILIQQEK